MEILSIVFSNMSAMNLSEANSPIVVETSILVGEMSLKKKLIWILYTIFAFTKHKDIIIETIMLLWYVIHASWVGPIIMSLPAKNPIIKSSWRT